MRFCFRLIPLCLVSLATGVAALPAGSAWAQDQVTVTDARLDDVSKDVARLTLHVDSLLPPFSLASNDGPKIEFDLAGARRGNGASLAQTRTALIRDVEFRQNGQVLSLIITGNAAMHAAAVAETPRRVSITFSRLANSGAPDSAPATNDNGPDEQAATVRTSELGPGETYELVKLKYADVSEVVGLLTQGATVKPNDSFTPQEPAFGSNSLTGNNYNSSFNQPQTSNSDQPMGQSVSDEMAIDRRLNAVLLKGTPERIAQLKAMIEAVDQPVDSVILETQLVELTENGSKAVGIDFANANGQIAVATLQSGQYIPYGQPPSDGGHLNAGGYLVGGHLNSVALQAAIYAQVEKGQGRIVSSPRIAAQSGSTAKIVTGDALPILTAITLSGVNGVSQQVQYVNVGVTLQIAPRVSGDGFVSSHIFCVVSSVSGYSQGYPTISQREAETSATVADGQSFIIGGLTQDSSIKSRTKVPLLGDIPLIGQVFRTDRATLSKTNLYIVVTPHIVHRVGATDPSVTPPPPPTAQ